jgi:hypothetical protein
MPRVKAKILAVKIDAMGRKLAKVQFNDFLPQVGEIIEAHWGSTRTGQQNNFYWKFLTWLINDAGLKEQGHFSVEGLHEDLKSHFLSEKVMDKGKFKIIEEGTTTNLGKMEFVEYIDKINQLMIDFFKIDTSPFFTEYQQEYSTYQPVRG